MKSIILAGGSGSRLWPLSRDEYPKQLLSFDENESLLQKTFKRLCAFSKPSEIVTITNVKHYSNIKLQLNGIDKSNIVIGEPIGRNTAPAIASTLEYFKQTGVQDDIVLIVPSDHLIKNIAAFSKTVEQGKILEEKGYIVTFGIKPDYHEKGYGYIKTEKAITTGYKVEKFVEKPNLDTAKEYLESGNYYWNSGIFMGKISVFLSELEKYAPEIYKNISELKFNDSLNMEYIVYEKIG